MGEQGCRGLHGRCGGAGEGEDDACGMRSNEIGDKTELSSPAEGRRPSLPDAASLSLFPVPIWAAHLWSRHLPPPGFVYLILISRFMVFLRHCVQI